MDPEPKPIAVGRGELLRVGDDVALVALGKTVPAAEAAAELLAEKGITASVVDARYVKPLDAELTTAVAERTGLVVAVEDHMRAGGFGSAVLELLSERAPDARVLRLGISDHFVEHGDADEQWREEGIDSASIAKIVERTLDGGADA
jgi:1-deoxy-D-xylulose-5-phosphate synthase